MEMPLERMPERRMVADSNDDTLYEQSRYRDISMRQMQKTLLGVQKGTGSGQAQFGQSSKYGGWVKAQLPLNL